MSDSASRSSQRMQMRPYQIEFVNNVLSAPKPSAFLVDWPVGAGKSRAALALVEEALQLRPRARVLVLVSSIAEQQFFVDELARDGVSAEVVDRYTLRAKQSEAREPRDVWVAGSPHILSLRLAAKRDVFESLSSVEWQLVILTEGPRSSAFDGTEMLERLGASSPDLQVVIFGGPDVAQLKGVGNLQKFESSIRFDELIASGGETRSTWQEPHFKILQLSPSEGEQQLGTEVAKLTSLLNHGSASHQSEGVVISRKVQSSQAALDDELRRLRTRIALRHRESERTEPDTADERGSSSMTDLATILRFEESTLLPQVDKCLERLELLAEDSKLAEVAALLRVGTRCSGICLHRLPRHCTLPARGV
jgi:hypothetical protein